MRSFLMDVMFLTITEDHIAESRPKSIRGCAIYRALDNEGYNGIEVNYNDVSFGGVEFVCSDGIMKWQNDFANEGTAEPVELVFDYELNRVLLESEV